MTMFVAVNAARSEVAGWLAASQGPCSCLITQPHTRADRLACCLVQRHWTLMLQLHQLQNASWVSWTLSWTGKLSISCLI